MNRGLLLKLLKEYSENIDLTRSPYYVRENIPDFVAQRAIDSYAKGVNLKDIFAIIDTSPARNGTNGYLFTSNAVYMKEGWNTTQCIEFQEIDTVKVVSRYMEGNPSQKLALKFVMRDGSTIRWSGFVLDDHIAFAELMNCIVRERLEENTIESDQFSSEDKPKSMLDRSQILNKYEEFLNSRVMLEGVPPSKIQNALSSIAPGVNPQSVLGVIDLSLFSSYNRGIIFSQQEIHILGITGKHPIHFAYTDIEYVKAAPKNPKFFYKDEDKTLIVYLKNGTCLSFDNLGWLHKTPLAWMMMELAGVIKVRRKDIAKFLETDAAESAARQQAILNRIEAKVAKAAVYIEKERHRMESR